VNRSHLTVYSSWGLLLSVTFVSLITFRVALSYVTQAELGLWIVIRQTLGYLIMLDFGVGISVARLYGKAASEGSREAQSVLTNSTAVLLVQAGGIIVIGLLLGTKIGDWFGAEESLHEVAFVMLSAVCVTGAIKQIFRVKEAYLFSQNKFYIVNWIGAASTWVEFAVLWLFLHNGYGLLSFVASQVALITVTVVALSIYAKRNSFRNAFAWKDVKLSRIREIFSYSVSMFVIGVFGQILFVGQPILVGLLHGLEKTTMYSINMRCFLLVRNLLSKLGESFMPQWQITMDRGGVEEVGESWLKTFQFMVALSALSIPALLLFNEKFVAIFGGEGLYLSRGFDAISALLVLVHLVVAMLVFPFMLSMKVRKRALVSVVQGIVAIILAVIFGKQWGPVGVVSGVVLGIVCTGGIYCLLVAPRQLALNLGSIFSKVVYPNAVGILLATISILLHLMLDDIFLKTCVGILICGVGVFWIALIHKEKLMKILK